MDNKKQKPSPQRHGDTEKLTEFNKQYELPLKARFGMVHDKKGNHVMDFAEKAPDGIYNLLSKLEGADIDIPIENKPVKYNPTKITDSKGKHLISIRGWGRFKYLPNGAEIQDRIGNEIAEIINRE